MNSDWKINHVSPLLLRSLRVPLPQADAPVYAALWQFSLYDSADAKAKPLVIPKGECTGHEKPKPTSCMIKSSTKLIPPAISTARDT